jgi:ABC-type sugar transport system permease subunit
LAKMHASPATNARAGARGPRANRHHVWRSRETLTGYLFVLPAIIGLTLFVIYPLITAAYLSLTNWTVSTDPVFVGLDNFRTLFQQDVSFWPSLQATGIYALMTVTGTLVLGLLLATLLNRNVPGIKLYRTLLYMPAILPAVATLELWKLIYDPQIGLANQILDDLHLPTSLWMGSYTMAMPAMVVVNLWGVGATMIIFLAGLQAVPDQLYEAARIDGARRSTIFLRLTLPMISPILFLQLVTQSIAALQAFTQPALLSVPQSSGSGVAGGPGFTTYLFMYSIYANGFGGLSSVPQMGYAVAQVWVLFAIILVFTVALFRFSSMWVFAESSLD